MGGYIKSLSCVCLIICVILKPGSDAASFSNKRWTLKTTANKGNSEAVSRLRRSLHIGGNKTHGTAERRGSNRMGDHGNSSIYTIIGKVWPAKNPYSSNCNHSEELVLAEDSMSSVIVPPTVRGYYQANCVCRWKISTHGKRKILLDFQYFDLEFSDDCVGDSVSIYDGPDEHATPLGTFCGEMLPRAVATYNDHVLVKFASYPHNHFKKGFRLEARAYTINSSDINENSASRVSGLDWGAICSERTVTLSNLTSGVIRSPSGSDGGYYPSKAVCRWRVVVPKYKKVQLDFKMLDIEFDKKCMADTLWIFDGRDEESVLLGKFCGNKKPHPVLSTKYYLFLLFTSDDRHTYNRGFEIKFTAVNR